MSNTVTENLVLDFDGWMGSQPPEIRAGIDAHLKASGANAARAKKELANMAAVADETGLDLRTVNENWSTVRGGYAEKQGGDWLAVKDDEEGFNSRLVQHVTKKRDFRIQADSFRQAGEAFALRMNPGDPMAEAVRLRESSKLVDSNDPTEADKYFEAFWKARQEAEEQYGPLRPIAKSVYEGLASADVERFSPETQAKIESAIDQLAMLPQDQRGAVMAMMKQETGSDNSGTASKTANAAIRGLTAQLRGFAENTKRGNILRVQNDLEGSFLIPEGNTPEQAYKSRLMASWADVMGPLTPGTREATEEEKAQIKALADQDLIRSDVAAQAIGVMEGTIDPIKTKGMWQKTAVNVGESLGAMAPIAIPYGGIVLAQGGYADQEYNRQRQMGTDPGTAHNLAQVTGTVQAGLERGAFLFNFAPTTRLGSITSNLAKPVLAPGRWQVGAKLGASPWFQVPVKMAGVQAAEYTEEIGQDFAPVASAKMGEMLGWSLPEQARMAAEWKRWKVVQPETFIAVAALSMFGGGFQGLQNTVQARAELTKQVSDPVNIQAVGIAPAEAERIAALPEDQRLEAFKQAYPDRDPSTKEAETAQQTIADRVQTKVQEGQQEIEDLKQGGITIERTPEGWNVTDAETGDALPHASAETAMQTARQVMLERGIQKEETFLDSLGEFVGKMSPGRAIAVANHSESLLNQLETAEAEGKPLNVKAVWDRADDYRASQGQEALTRDMENPESRNALEGLYVLGRSSTEVQNNAAKSISLIFKGGGTLDLVEEQAENDLREAVHNKRTSLPVMRSIIQRIEATTGDKYLHTDTDTGITEAWSKLVRLYTTGTKKEGNKITGGARAETAADLRAERRRLRQAEAQGIAPAAFAKLREYYDQVRAMLGQVARLMKAQKEGKLDDLEAMIRESVGLKEQDTHDAAVEKLVQDEAVSFSLKEGEPGDNVPGNERATATSAGTNRHIPHRPGAWASPRADTNPRRSAEIGRRVFEEILPGLSKPSAGGIYQAEIFGAEIAAVHAGRKPVFHDALGEEMSAAAAEKLKPAFPELHVEAFGPHLIVADPVQLEKMGATIADVKAAAESDAIGEFLGYGAPTRDSGPVMVRMLDSAGDTIAGFYTGLEHQEEFAAERERDYRDVIPGVRSAVTLPEVKTTYAITTADRLERLSERLKDYARDPETRFKMYDKAREKLAGMARSVRYNDKAFTDTTEGSARRNMLRMMQALDAILAPFPPEVRVKVGGFVKLASLTTNRQMENFIRKRMTKLDKVLEGFLKKEYTNALQSILDKSIPPKGKPGEKMVGKLGPDVQHLMDVVRDASKYGPQETEEALAALDARIASGDLTPEQEALAERERELVNLVGDWSNATAAEMSAAVQAVKSTFEGGYLEWQAELLAKREKRAAMRTAMIADTGKGGTPEERDERTIKDLGFPEQLKNFFLPLSSFEQVLQHAFGKDSTEAIGLADAERKASYQYEDDTQALADRVADHFKELAGGDALKGEQIAYDLAQKNKKVQGRTLSEMEIMQAALMWAQPDGRRHMEGPKDENGQSTKWSYDQDFMTEAMAQLSPEGLATLEFIQQVYSEEYEGLNELYRKRHGVNLPRNDNYAPITVAPQQAKAGEMVDPVSGAAVSGSILTPGSLRTRSRSAIAEPQFRDALQTLLAHRKQIDYWKAYGEFAVEAQAVLGNRDVGNAVEAAVGTQGKTVLRKWVDYFAQGGNRDAGAGLATNTGLSKVTGRAARMALVGRVGTLMIQATQIGAALAEMPTGAYLTRFGKLMSGQMGWKDAIDSDFIQRRLREAPPIVKQGMEGLKADKPNEIKHAVARVGQLISGADALFTAGTYAIVLDHRKSELAKAGFTGPEADAQAHKEAERITERVAQPTRAGTRSLYENVSTNPLAKLGWAFASESRQKMMMAFWAGMNAGKDPAQAARTAAAVFLVGGTFAAILRNAWRDARDDDDDELFDEKHWSLKRLLTNTVTAPLKGIPGIGDALESAVNKATGEYSPSGNLLSSVGDAVPAVKRAVTGETFAADEPVEQTLKDVESIMTAAGMANETAANLASILHVVRDGVAILDQFRDDVDEAKGKKDRAMKKLKKDAKEARKSQ